MKIIALLFLPLISLFGDATILLIRHGETDANVQGRYFGWIDIPLNKKGHEQAERLALCMLENHPDLAAIYSSDLTRARQTAQPTADAFHLPIHESVQLREINWGKGEGITQEEKERLYGESIQELLSALPERKKRWDAQIFPEAESYNALYGRLIKELCRIAKTHPDRTVAIFSHGRAIKTLLAETLDDEHCHYPGNCEILRLTLDPEEETLKLF